MHHTTRVNGQHPTLKPQPGVVGASGGVGTTTLARFLDYDDWTTAPPADPAVPLVVAAAPTADSSRALIDLIHQLGARDGRVVVAIVDDGLGTWPPAVRARARNLHGHVTAVVHVPYVPVWRYAGRAGQPATAAYSDTIRRIAILTAPPTYTGATPWT